MQALSDQPLADEELRQWKFFHDGLGVNHISYKAGAYIVDEVLRSESEYIDVIDLVAVPWADIWQLYYSKRG